MEFVYVMTTDGDKWEDIVIYLSEEEAIKESINHPNHRIEIFAIAKCFSKTDKSGYTPTYNYYKNGKYTVSC